MINKASNLIGLVLENKAHKIYEALRQNVCWDDAVSVQRSDDSNQPDYDITTRYSFVYRRLGHLTVNPNKKESNEALVNSYVFSSDKRPGIVNKDHESTKVFIDRLIKAAHVERKLSEQSSMPDPASAASLATRMFILHGHRGTGKTFFLNYLLSRFWERLDAEKVIWVRINLVMNFGVKNDLLSWVPAQATKILLRYYDKNHKSRSLGSEPPVPLDFIAHLNGFIEKEYSEYPERLNYYRDKVIMMRSAFRDLIQDKTVNEDMVPQILGEELMRFARENGYSFIVVLDGLDRLDITTAAKKKFDSICRQVDLIGRSYESPGYALVVSSRTKTLTNTTSCFSDPYRQASSRALEMGGVELLAILSKRLDMIRDEIPRIAGSNGWDLNDWPAHIEEFRNRLFDDTDSFISSLSDALGEDRRSQMQMVQLDYLDYLETKKERAYQLIEYLTKAGKQYPPRYYFYAKEENGDLVQACNAEPTPLDSKFFPTIFSFPRLQEGFSDMPNHDQSMLIGLRMAQLVVSCTELILNKEVEFFDPLIAHELASICEILFGYERQVIYALLEEFAEFDLIQLNGGLYQIPIRRDDYVISV
jgi:hypothetical protein